MECAPELCIRPFASGDVAPAEALLASSITSDAANFHWTAPAPGSLAADWRAATVRHVWLSLEVDRRWAGFASSRAYQPREAYKWSTEVGIYLEPWARGRHLARPLYRALLVELSEAGFRLAVARITLPGEASCALHAALGFEHVGTLCDVGWKLGRWWDVSIWQYRLAQLSGAAGP